MPMLAHELNKRIQGLEDATRKGYPIRNLYRTLYLKDLWMLAYANIQGNKGALTEGVDNDTLDGFSEARVNRIIESLRQGKYEPKPVRREFIPKANGKTRPLGIPSGTDKLAQEAFRILLERIYDPIFSDRSHGFRQGRSCHTALSEIQQRWIGVKWLIDVDISSFFDNIDHEVLLKLLRKKVDDKRFLSIIDAWLKAGYVDNWVFHKTFSGTPQGGIISPLLANIYLHELDQYLENLQRDFDKGKARRKNPKYVALTNRAHWLRKKIEAAKATPTMAEKVPELLKELDQCQAKMRMMSKGDPDDPDFKRLKFVRYADDFVIGIIGTKEDAINVLEQVKAFITSELKLEVSKDKTKIQHISDGCKFLGYEVIGAKPGRLVTVGSGRSQALYRSMSGKIRLHVPQDVPAKFCTEHGYGNYAAHHATHRGILLHASEVEIIQTFNSELRGIANYYALADNAKTGLGKLFNLGHLSLYRTLAAKYRTSAKSTEAKLKKAPGEHCLNYEVKGVAKSLRVYKLKDLKRKAGVVTVDLKPRSVTFYMTRTELLRRLNAGVCECCGSDKNVEVHHVRKLKDIKRKGTKSIFDLMMIARRRKTLVLCEKCHDDLHAGKMPDRRFQNEAMESRMH